MSKLVRIDEDCEDILRKYSSGSINDCIREMENRLVRGGPQPAISPNLSREISEEVNKKLTSEFQKLKESIRNVNSEFMAYLSSGQGAARVYPVQPTTYTKPVTQTEFKTALEVMKEKEKDRG